MVQLWLSFQGRATRSDYWLRTFLPILVISIVLSIVATVTSTEDQLSPAMFVYLAFSIFSIWPSIAVSVKRLHDRDQSGWWILIGLIPIIGSIYLFVVVGCLRGTVGENRFGPDPLGGEGLLSDEIE